MALSLPEDVEPWLTEDYEQLRGPAVYALELNVPDNIREQWNQHYDVTPDYLEAIEAAERTLYVGAAKDLLHRLEDHNSRDVRKSALLRVCEIDRLANVWWFQEVDRAFERESGLAMMLNNQTDSSVFVHQR